MSEICKHHIKWRIYKGVAGDLQTMLVGECNGVEFSSLFNDNFIFKFNLSKVFAERRIIKAAELLHSTHKDQSSDNHTGVY